MITTELVFGHASVKGRGFQAQEPGDLRGLHTAVSNEGCSAPLFIRGIPRHHWFPVGWASEFSVTVEFNERMWRAAAP